MYNRIFFEVIKLEIPKECDVIVIGGGISGCATAYYLAKGGLNVVVVEQRSIASGATGRNGSCLTQLDGRTMTPERVKKRLPFVRSDIELLKGLNAELGRDIELQQFGSTDLSTSEEESEELRKVVEIQKAGGDGETDFYERAELKELYPALPDHVVGGKFCRIDGSVNPIKMCWSFAMAAHERHKARMITQTRVEKIIIKGGKALGVETDAGDIMAHLSVINCTNAWSPLIAPEVVVFPVLNVVSVTEQVPLIPIITWEYTYKGYYCYGTSQKNGSLIIGGLPTREPETFDERFVEEATFEDLERFAGVLGHLYPSLKDVSFLRIWAGVFAMTPDRLPYIGPMPGHDNYFVNTGYSNGMGYCIIGAKLTSEYILNNGKTSIPLDLVKTDRFAGMNFKVPKRCSYKQMDHLLHEWDL